MVHDPQLTGLESFWFEKMAQFQNTSFTRINRFDFDGGGTIFFSSWRRKKVFSFWIL